MDNNLKISKITVDNFKAIISNELPLNGCSIIVTAKNDAGKTSLLRGMIDRFRGLKPEFPVNKNADKGTYLMELSNGEKIEWRFTEKSEQINLYTSNGMKITSGVISYLADKYFGKQFSINDFLKKSDTDKTKYLLDTLSIDVSEIDKKYKEKYDERTNLNRDLKNTKGLNLTQPVQVEKPNIDSLAKELENANSQNSAAMKKWEEDNEKHKTALMDFNNKQIESDRNYEKAQALLKTTNELFDRLFELGYTDPKPKNIYDFLNGIKKGEERKELDYLPKPDLINTDEIRTKINEANRLEILYNNYERDVQDFNKWQTNISNLEKEIEAINKDLSDLKEEKDNLLKTAKIPEEFTITDEGNLLYKDLPLSESQTSTSGLYIAALKLGRLGLGQLQTMHFEASALDKENLEKILIWAEKENLQLLIERPDYDGNGEITYRLIENNN